MSVKKDLKVLWHKVYWTLLNEFVWYVNHPLLSYHWSAPQDRITFRNISITMFIDIRQDESNISIWWDIRIQPSTKQRFSVVFSRKFEVNGLSSLWEKNWFFDPSTNMMLSFQESASFSSQLLKISVVQRCRLDYSRILLYPSAFNSLFSSPNYDWIFNRTTEWNSRSVIRILNPPSLH